MDMRSEVKRSEHTEVATCLSCEWRGDFGDAYPAVVKHLNGHLGHRVAVSHLDQKLVEWWQEYTDEELAARPADQV